MSSSLQSLRDRLYVGELLPWRLSHLGGPYNTLLGVHLRRPLLRRRLRAATRGLADDVTVIIGHRNRADYRLRNAIRSIQAQEYPAGRVHALVVDYGSTAEQRDRLRDIVASLGVECILVEGVRDWNRAHCLNIGIRRTATKFIMLSDVDVMLAPDFLSVAIGVLKADPLTAVYSLLLHLPEATSRDLEAGAETPGWLDLAALKPSGVVKTTDQFSTGMVVVHRYFLEMLRGYDEFYRSYGAEDTDIAQRLLFLGLRQVPVWDRTYYLHQWHPRYEGVDSDALEDDIRRNHAHLRSTHSLVRNPGGWGELPRPGAA